jgi:hypothetical protein
LDDPPERVAKFQLGQAYRLPLWELVYHDCVVAQWYWGDYNNKLPALWDKRDLFNVLYGTPPMFMFDRKLWETQKARFVQSYTNTCPYVRAAGYADNRVILVRNEPHITHDGGATWFGGHTYPAPGQKPGPRSAWVCNGLVVTTTWHFYIDPFEPNRQYICYTDIGLARSTDAGQSWIWWDPKSWSPWRNTCYEMAFDPETPGKIWGAFSDVHDIPNDNIITERHGHQGPGGICLSTDFGVSWKSQTEGLPRKPVTSIVLDPTSPKNARTLYAGVFDEGVFKSTDDGKTWTLKKTGLGHPDNMRVYRVILHRDGTLFAVICAKRPAPASRSCLKAPASIVPKTARRLGKRSMPPSLCSIPRTSPLIPATAGESCWARRTPAGATNPAASTSPRTAAKPGSASAAKGRRLSAAISTRSTTAGFT